MYAKRSLGQNFLTSQSVVKTIARTGGIQKNEVILEVGPGKGILTRELLEYAKVVIAFEKDDALFEKLKEKFGQEIALNKLILIHDDIFNFEKHRKTLSEYLKDNLKVVANIPYNITGKLLPFFFELTPTPKKIVILVQKEVAERIVASNKKESVLSISVKAFGNPKYIQKVPARLFSPKPRVDSAILSITDVSRSLFIKTNEKAFFEILKKGFSQKRKLLKNNLGLTEDILRSCGIKESARAEELDVSNWICLAKKYEQ